MSLAAEQPFTPVISMSRATALDKALMAAFPIVATPYHGELEPMKGYGKRIVLGTHGVYVEARSPVLHVRVQISECQIPHLGEVDVFIELLHGKLDAELLRRFGQLADAAAPNEVAGMIVHHEGQYQLHAPEVVSADAAHVSYKDVIDEVLVLDLHSHGSSKAFFSATDDASDLSRPGPYIAGVLGHCGLGQQKSTAMRLVISPYLLPITWQDFMELVKWK